MIPAWAAEWGRAGQGWVLLEGVASPGGKQVALTCPESQQAAPVLPASLGLPTAPILDSILSSAWLQMVGKIGHTQFLLKGQQA